MSTTPYRRQRPAENPHGRPVQELVDQQYPATARVLERPVVPS